MLIRVGYDITFSSEVSTPTLLMMSVHPSRRGDLLNPDTPRVTPEVPVHEFIDMYGNLCQRFLAPPGHTSIFAEAIVRDSGEPDINVPDAVQHSVDELPDDVLPFLLPSRYCEVDKMQDLAWQLFGITPVGWGRVQAICDWVHANTEFGYHHARSTKTAFDVHTEGNGVCRDFTHLAVTFCRCMNIPARYCNGYLGDIGVPASPSPMDFNAWFEAYLGGRWYTFDARHNERRIGRVLLARGRDATDIPMFTTTGVHWLEKFTVVTEEVTGTVQQT